jgi:predicted dehydrogenase
MKKQGLSRRAFLAATTTTAVGIAGCATTNTARVVPKKHSPNEILNIAGIGVGGMGNGDISGCEGENIVGMCDVDWKRAEGSFYRVAQKHKDMKKFKDYRVMLDEIGDSIDAVTVSTPDHTHAPAAYRAMKMGKHARVQKPLTHTIAEARLLADTAKEMNLVTQMGNQGHSGDGVRELCEMLWDGIIGDVQEAHIWTNRPVWPQGIAAPLEAQPVPDTMDWDLWIGSAPERPYNGGYAPFKWRGWWDFGCGAVGDMACHIMDPAFWALKLADAPTFSCEILMQEGMTDQTPPTKSIVKLEFPARGTMPPATVYWYDGEGNFPTRPEGVPADEELGEGSNGSFFIGSDGVLTTGCYGADSRLCPAAQMKDYKKPAQSIPRVPGGNHTQDWINAIKQGRKASSDFAYAAPLTIVANMGNVALLANSKIEYDVANMKVTNNKAANKFLTKPYRKGWELPC